jgi:hypothetical protein
MFKLQITLDRHNARQNLKYCVLPHPPYFSLPSTFKAHSLGGEPGEGAGGANSDEGTDTLVL